MGVWAKSDLCIGEDLKVPSSLFVEGEKSQKRLLSSQYIGESHAGIFIKCSFQPPVGSNAPRSNSYIIMINWQSIWCGAVKIRRIDGTLVKAVRK